MGWSDENVGARCDFDRIDVDPGWRTGQPRGAAHVPTMGANRGEVMTGRLAWPATVTLKKETLAWIAGVVLSLLLFFFLTFPFGTLQSRVISELIRATGWDIRAADWSPALPLAVEWHDLAWTKPGGASIPVQLMRLNVGVLGLLAGHQTVDALVQFPGGGQSGAGRATGTVTASSWSCVGAVSLNAHAQQPGHTGV